MLSSAAIYALYASNFQELLYVGTNLKPSYIVRSHAKIAMI